MELLEERKNGSILLDQEALNSLLCSIDTVIFTFNILKQIVEKNISDIITNIKKLNLRIIVLCNDSNISKTDLQSWVLDKKLGIEMKNLYCCAEITAYCIKHFHKTNGYTLVVGPNALITELSKQGIEYLNFKDSVSNRGFSDVKMITRLNMVSMVLVDQDPFFDIIKAIKLVPYLKKKSVIYAVLNLNKSQKISSNDIDNNSIISLLLKMSDRKPDFYFGLPEVGTYKYLINREKLKSEKTLFVTDRIDPDVIFANRCGYHSLLIKENHPSPFNYKFSHHITQSFLTPEFVTDNLYTFMRKINLYSDYISEKDNQIF